jgi:hypothetical protein
MSRSLTLAALASLSLLAACADMSPKPRGTVENNATTRAVDRAAGTNSSGAYPLQTDGMPGNPPGTAVGRAVNGTLK